MGAIEDLRQAAGSLTDEVDALVAEWVDPVLARIAADLADVTAKTINDPVWQTIDLEKCEVLLLDSPLMQRLRGVKQLGLAHLVFPGATHDRFAHSCGIVEATERMLASLQRNAQRRDQGSPLPTISPEHRRVVRLAALLHDTGHGPFSHAIEPVVERLYKDQFSQLRKKAQTVFSLDNLPQTAELLVVLMVCAPKFVDVLRHGSFGGFSPQAIAEQMVACILGARAVPSPGRAVPPPFLTAIVSSSIDADKMDYLARDAHHAGLPIAFDTPRLVSKLEFLKCNQDTLPKKQSENVDFANAHDERQYFDLGLADGGVGAFEQMLVNRAFLYDRLYHHHKVRVADAMAQRLAYYAQKASQGSLKLKQLYLNVCNPDVHASYAHVDGIQAKRREPHFATARRRLGTKGPRAERW